MSTRKKVVIFGNCQAIFLSSLIKISIDSSDYKVEAFLNTNRSGLIAKDDIVLASIKACDILIFQPLNDAHGELSEDSLNDKVQKICKKIRFPYVFNSGVYSLCHAPMVFSHSYGYIYGQEAIIDLLKSGLTKEEIIAKYLNGTIDFKLVERFNKCIEELKHREHHLDILLSTFLVGNITQDKLFLTHNHPTLPVFCEMLKQISILAELNISQLEKSFNNIPPLNQTNCPITPHDVAVHNYNFPPDHDWKEKGIELIIKICQEFS